MSQPYLAAAAVVAAVAAVVVDAAWLSWWMSSTAAVAAAGGHLSASWMEVLSLAGSQASPVNAQDEGIRHPSGSLGSFLISSLGSIFWLSFFDLSSKFTLVSILKFGISNHKRCTRPQRTRISVYVTAHSSDHSQECAAGQHCSS